MAHTENEPQKNAFNEWLRICRINQTRGFIKCMRKYHIIMLNTILFGYCLFVALANKATEQTKADQYHHHHHKEKSKRIIMTRQSLQAATSKQGICIHGAYSLLWRLFTFAIAHTNSKLKDLHGTLKLATIIVLVIFGSKVRRKKNEVLRSPHGNSVV